MGGRGRKARVIDHLLMVSKGRWRFGSALSAKPLLLLKVDNSVQKLNKTDAERGLVQTFCPRKALERESLAFSQYNFSHCLC